MANDTSNKAGPAPADRKSLRKLLATDRRPGSPSPTNRVSNSLGAGALGPGAGADDICWSDDGRPTSPRHISDEEMQLVNKERQRKIRNELLTTIPPRGTAERETWDLNRLDSPLLRLPPELRNQIYKLVAEVGQINVCFKKFERWKARTHTNGQRYYETATPGGFFCRVLDRDQNPWNFPHASPCPRGVTLLSSVCRMLYKETVLLPYSLNVWSFDKMSTMERYILKEKRLPRPQARAIRVLYTKVVLPDRFDRALGGLDVMLVSGGLKLTRVVDPHDPEGRTKTWDISRW